MVFCHVLCMVHLILLPRASRDKTIKVTWRKKVLFKSYFCLPFASILTVLFQWRGSIQTAPTLEQIDARSVFRRCCGAQSRLRLARVTQRRLDVCVQWMTYKPWLLCHCTQAVLRRPTGSRRFVEYLSVLWWNWSFLQWNVTTNFLNMGKLMLVVV